ncbi:MAG: 50S ribosomal protein L18 [bacterium]
MGKSRKEQLKIRHKRVRKKIKGTAEQPRLNIFRSTKHIYAQVIDDDKGITLTSASTMTKEFKEKLSYGGNIEAAKVIGIFIAQKSLNKGINKVVFDRGGNIYHGRVKALAESARENGLKF